MSHARNCQCIKVAVHDSFRFQAPYMIDTSCDERRSIYIYASRKSDLTLDRNKEKKLRKLNFTEVLLSSWTVQ